MNLLINEPPLQVLPSLAIQIGLNEAIIIQQVHYWLLLSKNERDGFKWVYKKYEDWEEEFPFWSNSTIRRSIRNLEKEGLLISSDKYNKFGADKTKWYRINYQKLMNSPVGQNEQSQQSNRTVQDAVNLNDAITREYTENTTEKKNSRKQAFDDDSPEMFLAHHLDYCIRKNRPQFKQPNLQSWCKEFNNMLRIDERDFNEIQSLITWAQAHHFWKGNILSPKKLRVQYDTLAIQMQETMQSTQKFIPTNQQVPQRPQINYGVDDE
ncbi:replication protein (plasmid) [Lysinibacillus capsici]|uniref:replication protein n=2 Tax=Lysinibacillus capsici TaxID=2115968 RepID=UPI0021D8BF5A|nr:replication protein [Lysinibacillus capsici]UYB50132.1 replication protein [Lysinibacillus capsici]